MSSLRDHRFPLPKGNEYQWRNLYIRQFGFCSYMPPMPSMPRNPNTASPRRRSPSRHHDDVSYDGISDDDDVRNEWSRLSGSRSDRDAGLDRLNQLTDEQLFSPSLFTFLSRSGSLDLPMSERAPCPARPPRDRLPLQRKSMVLPSILRAGSLPQRNAEGHVAFPSNSPRAEETAAAKLAGEVALTRLQRETWQLLMDNRIMTWFEREANERGRIAASVQRRLLEVVSWTPTQRQRVAIKTETDTHTATFHVLGDPAQSQLSQSTNSHPKQPQSSNSAPPEISATLEDERLMQTLERFGPFFAVISPSEILNRLFGQLETRKTTSKRSVVGDTVGLPLLSQYATWREAYENRKAWTLAPFSYFLIHDCSYNYAHISALYVLLDLINSVAHTHTHDCATSDRQEQSGFDLGNRRGRSKEVPVCPLYVMQQLSDDLILAFEQSAARTTLPMALYVIDFLLDLLIDPDTATRFLSTDALRQQRFQSGGEGENMNVPAGGNRAQTKSDSKVHQDEIPGNGASVLAAATAATAVSAAISTASLGSAPAPSPAPVHVPVSVERVGPMDKSNEQLLSHSLPLTMSVEGSMGTRSLGGTHATLISDDLEPTEWIQLKQLNDTTFEDLFTLVHWFVDAPTANSGIPMQYEPEPHKVEVESINAFSLMSLRSKRNSAWGGSRRTTATSSAAESRRIPGVPATSVASSVVREATYIVSRTQEYEATSSVVEAIIRYEVHRQQLIEMRLVEQRNRAAMAAAGKRPKKRKLGATHRVPIPEKAAIPPELPAGATLLSSPLAFMTTYIRLHGAPWLKELLSRLFNILRKESVLLYVNACELEPPPRQPSMQESVSLQSISMEQIQSPGVPAFSNDFFRWRHLTEQERSYHYRLERLEDLICQDIQYVMNEFFSALYGKRSMTRLPQGISVLLTSLCTTIHLHLLSQHAIVDESNDKPAIRVRRCLDEMRQKRVTGGGHGGMWGHGQGHRQHDSTDRLIRSIEHHRLAKFILFDSWILPSMNNAVKFGFLPETASNHLRWNMDAFARYLKILVNASFIPSDGVDPYIHTTSITPSGATTNVGSPGVGGLPAAGTPGSTGTGTSLHNNPLRSGIATSPQADKRARSILDTIHQRCNTVKVPPFINGIYDVTSGSLMQVFHNPGFDEEEVGVGFTFGDSPTYDSPDKRRNGRNVRSATQRGNSPDASPKEVSKTYCDLSGALSSLNESLGITGGADDGETYEDDVDVTPARILNIFCARASGDISAKVVVPEYDVAPTAAAACISKAFSIMSGQHEVVHNAVLSGNIIGHFKSSPYLTCLMGVLLHPRSASKALENVFHNSRSFYNSLMKPLQDESLLSLLFSLTGHRRTPIVDSNELIPLIAAIPIEAEGDQLPPSLLAWEAATRRLMRRRALATTGEALQPEETIPPLLRRCAPTCGKETLQATAGVIQREMQQVPICFDTWWRAIAVALTVKAMNVMEECSDARSTQWEQWCSTQMREVQREYRGLCAYFTQQKGAKLDIPKSRALSYLKDRKSRRSSSLVTSNINTGLQTEAQKRRKSKRKPSKPTRKRSARSNKSEDE